MKKNIKRWGTINEVLLADSYDGGILEGNVYYPRKLHIRIEDYL